MNIWFLVILIFAIALIIGPIAMMRPKPAQRRKEALRMHAAKHGVRFGMRSPPKLKTAMEEPSPSPVYYLAPTAALQSQPNWMLVRTDYEHEGNFYNTWDWHGSQRPGPSIIALLRDWLPRLPTSVTVISQGDAGTYVYWSEKEGIELLDTLIKLIRELQAAETASAPQIMT